MKVSSLLLAFLILSSCSSNIGPNRSIQEISEENESFVTVFSAKAVKTWENVMKIYGINNLKRDKNLIRVHVKISRQGTFFSKEIISSCGNPKIDKIALETLSALEPFPVVTSEAIKKSLETEGMVLGFILTEENSLKGAALDAANFMGHEMNKEKSLISKESIDSTVKSHYSELEECLKKAKEHNEKLSGKIGLGWTIVGSGAVKDAIIIENETGDRTLAKCFSSKLKSWKFPKTNGASVEVDYYPFTIK